MGSRVGSRIAINGVYVSKRGTLRKLFLLTCLIVALAPNNAKAEDHDRDDRHKHRVKASEMTGIGIGAAALVGLAGYLLLRRRHSA